MRTEHLKAAAACACMIALSLIVASLAPPVTGASSGRASVSAQYNPAARGSLRMDPAGVFSASETRVAQRLADEGRQVDLRAPSGQGRTSDLLVDGVPYDV